MSIKRPPSRPRGSSDVEAAFDALDLAPDEVLDGEDAFADLTDEEVLAADDELIAPQRSTASATATATKERPARVAEPVIAIEPVSLDAAPAPLPVALGTEPSLTEWLQRRTFFGLTYWQLGLAGLLAVALVITRFYNLGGRAMHHDESMHAKFAWDTFHGQVYKYNPLLHGPFQFLAVASGFWLFGDTEATARAMPAIFGVGLVGLTFLWRRWLGNFGWLFAMAIFIFSPSFTYFARMLREDSYTATWTLLAATGLVGYVLHRRRPWFYAFCAGLALAFCTKESTYITAFIFGSFMILSLLWERATASQRRWLIGAVVGAIIGAFLNSVVGIYKKELHEVGGAFVGLMFGGVLGYAYNLIRPLPETPAVRTLPAKGNRRARTSAVAQMETAGTFTTALRTVWGDTLGFWGVGTFWGGVIIFFAIFVLFFSSFGTNLPGIREGLVGSIRYWLEQHGVQRGNQPWFYYFLILGTYETLEFLFAIVATVHYLRKPTWFTTFLIWWWITALVIYSWAGEKMPWLIIHIATPMVLLTARYLGELAVSATRGLWEKRLAFGGLALLAIWTIHTGWPVNFERPDTPKDLLVYTQTAPDVKKVMADITRISLEQTADPHGIGIVVQSGTWWPFSWYLRDFKNAEYPSNLTAQATKPIVLIAVEDDDKNRPFLQGYTRTRYKMRWWYPEDYRNITLHSFVDFFTKKDVRDGLWKWLIYRETTQPLGSYDFYVYMKDGLAPAGATAAPPAEAKPVINTDQYTAKVVPVNLVTQFGTVGKDAGQLNTPRGLATDSQGNIYVADSLNHRIQKFSHSGQPLASWGSQGNGDGQFQEPMGVAVDSQGNIYVADTWNHRIQKLDPNGKFITKWTGQGGFWGPRAIALDAQNNVYVTDTGNKRIQKFDSSGKFLANFGAAGSAPGQLNEPIGLAVTPDGQMYVADTNNHRIQHLDASGKPVAEWPVAGWQGGTRNEPYLSLDSDGNLLVTDPPNARVIEYSPSGEVLAVAGSAGKGAGQFDIPVGIVAGGDAIYVADSGNGRVEAINFAQ